MELVEEHSTYNTSEFLKWLEGKLEFKTELIQTDNGSESVNDLDKTNKGSRFEKQLRKMKVKYHRTRSYFSWQNGIVVFGKRFSQHSRPKS